MNMVKSRKIKIENGTEGPRQDPYSYTKYHVFTTYENGKEIDLTIHEGLQEYVQINAMYAERNTNELLLETFGVSKKDFIKAILKIQYIKENTCKHCGNTSTYSESGYPGETLYLCTKCNEIVYADMNLSAIM